MEKSNNKEMLSFFRSVISRVMIIDNELLQVDCSISKTGNDSVVRVLVLDKMITNAVTIVFYSFYTFERNLEKLNCLIRAIKSDDFKKVERLNADVRN